MKTNRAVLAKKGLSIFAPFGLGGAAFGVTNYFTTNAAEKCLSFLGKDMLNMIAFENPAFQGNLEELCSTIAEASQISLAVLTVLLVGAYSFTYLRTSDEKAFIRDDDYKLIQNSNDVEQPDNSEEEYSSPQNN